ncbi:hypothetical protein niasHT_029713 [Heterodera trifolii]|uniref:Uncharacterized protein n=1 Tax=Heterodera trifolii TaxID=157864 RepID=A0ABD2KQP0_9BILA
MTTDPAPDYFAACSWLMNICSFILYFALWLRLKLLSTCAALSAGEIQSNEANTRKVLQSLMIIFLVESFGWVSNLSVHVLLAELGASESTNWYVLSYCAFILQLSLSLNAPILYIRSFEYRLAFRSVFLPASPDNQPYFVRIVHPKNGQMTKSPNN